MSEETDAADVTYYDRPVIKEPVWIWSVPTYFHVGGVTAGAAMLGAVAQLAGGLDGLVRWSRRTAAVGSMLGTVLLIVDLGRPERFLNMLRVFRPTSAISVGSWTLAATGGTTTASVVLPGALGNAAGLASGALAPVLGTYTGVLLADTAVPVWRATQRSLPLLFGASALAGATSTLDLLPLSEQEHEVTHRLGVAAKVAELGATVAVERDADAVEQVGRALHEGVAGDLWGAAKILTALSLLVSLLPLPKGWRRRLSGVLGTLGGLALRFGLFQAGRASSRDPRATFSQQRRAREQRPRSRAG
ncbi:MAG: polysulfide reductase NrfD [Actinobacteria bacterium]|nr:polysulfide reductase NrfD [Actinomycetota bacterium]